ncbi:hypothetical protein TNCV_2901281 [Trichonephila clavipes]|nr:hypothetical protein TNCV_2901281 [Trichonephila clavipes]
MELNTQLSKKLQGLQVYQALRALSIVQRALTRFCNHAPCHDRPTNQDTLSQAGPITSGHIYNLDMGWRNVSRSVSQRRPAPSIHDEGERILEKVWLVSPR